MDQVIEIMSDIYIRPDDEKIKVGGRDRYAWEIKERFK